MAKATSKFGKAFAAARKAGKSTFSFGGKSYTTKLKGEGSSAPSKSARPASKPKKESMAAGRKGTPTSSTRSERKRAASQKKRTEGAGSKTNKFATGQAKAAPGSGPVVPGTKAPAKKKSAADDIKARWK